jgi:hypothetical protein
VRVRRIKITLLEMPSPVWRVVDVPGDITLAALQPVVQAAMGWEIGYHLHVFETARGRFRMPDAELGIQDQADVTLAEAGPDIGYTYDFGDGREHEIRVLDASRRR